MVKVLSWVTLAVAGVVCLPSGLTSLVAWDSLGDAAWWLVWFGAVPLAGLAAILAVVILVTALLSRIRFLTIPGEEGTVLRTHTCGELRHRSGRHRGRHSAAGSIVSGTTRA